MASNLSKRLDKLEKGIQQLVEAENPSAPIYISEGEPAPEGRDAVVIVMKWVEAEERPEGASEEAVSSRASNSAPRKQPATLRPIESPAEREKRWAEHLRAIDRRGERYKSEERARDWRRGIV